MQFLKISFVFFLYVFSSFAFSTNIVESVSETATKTFHYAIPTYTPGQYIEYNEKILTLRQYNNQGLHKEFSVELSGHSNNNAAFKAYLDRSANAIWITDSHYDSDASEYYLTIEKYLFDENGFTGEHEVIDVPAHLYGNIQGFSNSYVYMIVRDESSGFIVHNFNEYDISNKFSLVRSLKITEEINTRFSPNGKFFISNKGIISLTETEITWVAIDIDGFQNPAFIDGNTLIYKNWKGNYIGSVNESSISTSMILSTDPKVLQFEYNYHYLDSESRTINYYTRNNELVKSYSVDKTNDLWQLSEIESSENNPNYISPYRRTLEGGLITRDTSFTYNDGQWLRHETLDKGFELDTGVVYVSNTNDVASNYLYAVFTGDVNRLKKLSLNEDGSYQWRDIAELSKQSGKVKFAIQYQEKIYIIYYVNDDINFESSADPTYAVIVNMAGEHLETTAIPSIQHGNFKANVYNEHLYLTSNRGSLKCIIDTFHCTELTESLSLFGPPQYFNNFLYAYSDTDNSFVFYDTRSNGEWQKSSFELPPIYNAKLEKFGSNLRFNKDLLVLNESGEIDSLKPITSVNSDRFNINKYTNHEIHNEKISCDLGLGECIYIDGEYSLEFTPLNFGQSHRYKKIQGTVFYFDEVQDYHSIEIFRERENLAFPEIKEIMPKEIEIWQNETLDISLNNYFKNISYYEQESHWGWPDYNDDFIADSNGDFNMTLTNEHTWQEPTIHFATYTGFNDDFSIPIPPMNIMLRDINDPPQLREGANLTITKNKKDHISISFDDFFRDPEWKDVNYVMRTLPLPSGIESIFELKLRGFKGSFSKAGTYKIKVAATDASADKLSAEFTFTIQVKDANGNIPSTEEKSSDSGGSFSWILLMLIGINIYRSRYCYE